MACAARCFALTVAITLIGCQQNDAPSTPPADGNPTPFKADQATEAEHTRGVALMGQFDYPAAHDIFDALAQKYPRWDDVHVDLAISKLNRRQADDALDAAKILDRVIESGGSNLRAKYCRAILCFYNGEIERALTLFRAVADADPRDAYAAYFSGQCLFDLGRFEEALERFAAAQKCDPYLRSANYGAFQTLQRLNRADQAREQLALFQKLGDNPQARSAEIKYSRMGPKAEARTLTATEASAADRPPGALFREPVALPLVNRDELTWVEFDADSASATTVCDIDADGALDLFINGAIAKEGTPSNAVLWQTPDGWRLQLDHPLADVSDVNAVLWGDFDNDGHVDAYFCRQGPNQLWQQTAEGDWQDITAAAGVSAGDDETVDGALFDADHDGDLDLFVLQRSGKNELLNNNLDGSFRPLAAEQGIAGGGRAPLGVAVADFDQDRDADILVVNESAPHHLYLNNRLWNYTNGAELEGAPFAALLAAPITAAVTVDLDADGQTEIVTVSPQGVQRWSPSENGSWVSSQIHSSATLAAPLAVQDFDGDGKLEVLAANNGAAWVVIAPDQAPIELAQSTGMGPFAVAALSPSQGLSLVAAAAGQPPRIWQPGPGRFSFAAVEFSGQESKADQMRSNASGIGVQAAARFGGRWTALQTFRHQSGPGQSLQPVTVGLRGAAAVDYVHLVWPDGLLQTELGLASGSLHRIEETQRQVSSCPVLFVWDGSEFRFVSDVLGVGGLGFNHGRGEYGPPRPWENFLLPADLPVPRHGRFAMKIGEPMEETCYLDAARLRAYDLPDGWEMTLDERQSVGSPRVTGQPIFYRETIPTSAIVDQAGHDVSELLKNADGHPLPTGSRDRRFLARTEPFSVTLRFDQPINPDSDVPPRRRVLVIDGWVEYPYSQTMFAAWQAGANYDAPTLAAQTADGSWHTVYEGFGYPAGMPKQMSLPIEPADLPPRTMALRLTTNLEIYWDRIVLAIEEDCPQVQTAICPLAVATAQEVGFPRRRDTETRKPHYDYADRVPLWDTRHHPGRFTTFGDVQPLVAAVDDAVVMFGPGEETHLEFAADLPRVPDGWHRRFVLECHGWCKDMDLYTEHGESVLPLPRRDQAQRSAEEERHRNQLHEKFQRRYRSD